MIKRPLNSQFPEKVEDLVKITTIRDKPWPVGVPIMLYCWSGKPYYSKHENVCPVEVVFTTPIKITHLPSGQMLYDYSTCGDDRLVCIWSTEGFESGEEMDAWFRPLVKPGETVTKHLMRFNKLEVGS